MINILPNACPSSNQNPVVTGLAYHSARVRPGFVFVALPGTRTDGHRYLQDALAAGAVAAVVRTDAQAVWPDDRPLVRVPDTRRALALMASQFYGWPSRRLKLYGVTGTNGKTTTTYLLQNILTLAGVPAGVIGTLGCRVDDQYIQTDRTTPESLDLQAVLSEMVDQGVKAVVMEVSSHALALGRVVGCRFAGALFTNLTQDHLDFHASIDEYFAVKQRLFTEYADDAGADFTSVINIDCSYGQKLAKMAKGRIVTFGQLSPADVRAEEASVSASGTRFLLKSPFGTARVTLRLLGAFNLQNALAAAALALSQGVPLETVCAGLETARGVPGRFEQVDCGQEFAVIVDYAHTPDGLQKVLECARALCRGRLLTVFGCGGDRDPTKRPIMGRIGATMSDCAVITSDNPRSEDPLKIIEQVLSGVPDSARGRVMSIPDRREAIHAAISMAEPRDTVVIAGKGHENYQILRDRTIHFDDREVAAEAIRAVLHA
ncbi:MAG: UDP-N-acetylmuramoyl-L-alanyl-D-glutamate--2,6-diaminopimelate ligase [Armatimonadota bacterium]